MAQCPRCACDLELWKPGLLSGYARSAPACSRCGSNVPRRTHRFRCPQTCGFAVCADCSGRMLGAVTVASSPSSCRHLRRRRACQWGENCYDRSPDHLASFVHPGEADFRHGYAKFADSQRPDIRTLWNLFNFFNSSGSGNLNFSEFQNAASEICQRLSKVLDINAEWKSSGGFDEGHLSWVRFASWTVRVGVSLAVGIDDAPGWPGPCRCRTAKGEQCPCTDFTSHAGDICSCGHRKSAHRSDASERTFGARLVSNVPSHWRRGRGSDQLVPVQDMAVLKLLQRMLDATHKTTNNWTRDRGCALHGIGCCPPECFYKHKAPVPTGYILTGAFRNQNSMLWARYTLARAAILEDCNVDPCKPELVESSRSPLNKLDDNLPLVEEVNEWRLLHGTSEASCREICDKNFSMSFAGTGASWKKTGETRGLPLYGRGVYFAERITKADEYARPETCGKPGDLSGTCCMLVCRVIGGRPNVCLQNEIEAENLRKQVFTGPHHSVLGDRVKELNKPYREFVVYDRDQIFPEFLLTYVRTFA